jgi:hypothetical protein
LQPCASYEENVSVRRLCPRPFIMDENIEDIGVILKIWRDMAADAINLKISKASEERILSPMTVLPGTFGSLCRCVSPSLP